MSQVDAQNEHVDHNQSGDRREGESQGEGGTRHSRNRTKKVNQYLLETFGVPYLKARLKYQNELHACGYFLDALSSDDPRNPGTRGLSSAALVKQQQSKKELQNSVVRCFRLWHV